MKEIIQSRKISQPTGQKTGGSTFMNGKNFKAWELIDNSGCRGLKNGGAIMLIDNSISQINGSIIERNEAVQGLAGGLFLSSSNLLLYKSSFTNNTAKHTVNELYLGNQNAWIDIIDSTFTLNSLLKHSRFDHCYSLIVYYTQIK